MASNYTGNPSGNQSPSPSPGPGKVPIISIPAGTDVRTIESIEQSMKCNTDFIAYSQSTVQLSPPAVSTDGSGFSAIVHTGTGSGTCVPTPLSTSADQGSAAPYNYVVKIIAGGAVGTATFQVSLDGGTTYGATNTTASTIVVSPSGVSLNFAGTFVASDTYAFKGVDRPLLSLVGTSFGGVGAVEFDHFGFPQGKFQRFQEDWTGSSFTVSPGQTAAATWNRWLATTSAAGSGINTSNFPNITYPGQAATLIGSGSLGNASTLYTNAMMYTGYVNLYSALEFDLGINDLSATGADRYMGWASSTTPNADNAERALLWWDASTQKLYFQKSNGSVTISAQSPIQPTASNAINMRARIEIYGSSSLYGAMARFLIGGDGINYALCYVVANPFATGALMFPLFRSYNDGAVTGTSTLQIGSVRATWNVWT